MFKKVLYVSIVFFSVLTLSLAVSWFWYSQSIRPVSSGSDQSGDFVIYKDESAGSVLARLETAGYIRSALAAKFYLKFSRLEKKLSPGGYVLTPGLSVPEILQQLSHGPKNVWVTLPEGWRREQIGSRFASVLNSPSSTFDLDEFMRLTAHLEGRLFPDTYLIPPDISAPGVVSLLTSTFTKKTGLSDSPADTQTLIIASLIEREVKTPADRAIVSGVISKRLDNGWPLQIDATVQYASATSRCSPDPADCDWWQPITDTKLPSLFNTYLHSGLPPAPICNPGLASITAAASPQDSPYWYYLTGTDGQTYFAQTLGEHNLNIDKHLKR